MIDIIDIDSWFYFLSAFLFTITIVTGIRLVSKPRLFTTKGLKQFLLIVSCVCAVRMFLYVYFYIMTDSNSAGWLTEVTRFATSPEYQYSAIVRRLLMSSELAGQDPIYFHFKFWIIEVVVFAFGALVWSLPILLLIFKPHRLTSREMKLDGAPMNEIE
jgi:hypothetical protein